MNNDPYNEKKKSKIIIPVIVLILLLLLGWLLYSIFNNQESRVNQTNETTTSQQPAAENPDNQPQPQAVTDLGALLDTADAQNVIGRRVDIAAAPVYTVIGDKSFTVGTADQYAYALLAEQLDSGQTEQAVQVQAGEQRSLRGTVVAVPEDTAALVEQFQLNEQQIEELKAQGYYISVEDTQVQS